MPAFMEQSISNSDFVLVICTPGYRGAIRRTYRGSGLRGAHHHVGDFRPREPRKIHSHSAPRHLGGGKPTDAAPASIRGGYYIDLSGEAYPEEKYIELVLTLFGRRENSPTPWRTDVDASAGVVSNGHDIAAEIGRCLLCQTAERRGGRSRQPVSLPIYTLI